MTQPPGTADYGFQAPLSVFVLLVPVDAERQLRARYEGVLRDARLMLPQALSLLFWSTSSVLLTLAEAQQALPVSP